VVDPSFLQSVNVSILPRSDSTYDLGSSSYRWRNGYFAGILNIIRNLTSANQKVITIRDNTTTSGELWIGETTSTTNAFVPRIQGISENRNAYGLMIGGAIPIVNDVYDSLGGALVLIGDTPDGDLLSNANIVNIRNHNTSLLRVRADGTTELQNLRPMNDNSYDLGSSSFRWKNGYFAGLLDIGSLQIGGTEIIDGSRILKNIASIAQALNPSADNTYDVGSTGYRWKNSYLAGGLRLDGAIGLTPWWGWRKAIDIRSPSGSPEYRTITYLNEANSVGWMLAFHGSNDYFAIAHSSNAWASGSILLQVLGSGDTRTKTLTPLSDNSYDLGSSSYKWKNIYFAGNLVGGVGNLGSLQIGGTEVISSAREIKTNLAASGALKEAFRWTPSDIPGAEIIICQGTSKAGEFLPELHMKPIGSTKFAIWSVQIRSDDDSGSTPLIEIRGGTDSSPYTVSSRPLLQIRNYTTRHLLLKANGELDVKTTLPLADNTYDLGSSSYRWKNIYFAGNLIGANWHIKQILVGTTASRPSAGVAYRLYISTDEQIIYLDDGSSWIPLGAVYK